MTFDETQAGSVSGYPVLGIGASAGGIVPIREFIETLPSDLEAAVVVVVHLEPTQRSHLREIIAQVAGRPVYEAEDGMRVEPNAIYVIPPNRDLTIANGYLQVTSRDEKRGLYAPIDCFFISLAHDLGDQAFGIVLSGTGTDGTMGLREIKACGGVTFAQDEATAKQPSMPGNATKGGWVDFVSNPSDIAREVAALIRAHANDAHELSVLPTSDAQERETLLELLRLKTDVDFSTYKQTTIWRRVFRRMALKHVTTLREYVAFAEANPSELETLYQDILINVTAFFRDAEAFEALKKHVFPRIVAENPTDGTARIWVPGCSTGEEAYSLAMAFREYVEDLGRSMSLQIFGTDINESVIEKARAGLYAFKIADTVPADRLNKYFVKTKHGYQVTKTLRDVCVFARQNIVADPPLSKMDFISCRNMLIYLGPVLQRKVIPRLHYALKPGGTLLLGKSEVVDIFSDLFSPLDKYAKIYVRKTAALPYRIDLGVPSGATRAPLAKPAAANSRGYAESEAHREVDRLIAARYSPPAIVINESLDILQFRGQVKPLLELGSGLASLNVSKVISRDLALKIRDRISQAKEGVLPLAIDGVRLRHDGAFKQYNVSVTMLRSAGEHDRRFLLVFELVPTEAPRQLEIPSFLPASDLQEQVARLDEELRATREHLQATIDESEIRNEELQAANEEILSNNEELQTMNQELETSKEELESANEELVTLNEELQNHLEKLRESEERFRILVSGVKDYAIFMLGRDGHILSWNEGAERIKGYKPDQIIGRHFSVFYPPDEIRAGKPQRELEIASEKGVYSEEGVRVRADGSIFWANVVITALYNNEHQVVGFAKVTRDITERKLAEEALRRSQLRFRLLVENVRDYAIFMLDPDGHILSWNEGAENITGYSANEIIGQHISVMYRSEDRQGSKARLELEAAVHDGKYQEQGERRRKDGSLYTADIVVTPIYAADGKLEGFAKITRDITEKIAAEKALIDAHDNLEIRVAEATRELAFKEAQLRLVTNALPVLISYIDAKERYLFTNAAYDSWFGLRPELYEGQTVRDVFGAATYAALAPQLASALRGRDGEVETTYLDRSGSRRFVRATFYPDRADDYTVRGVVSLVEDVTQQRQHVEDMRQQAEELERANAGLKASNAELSQFAHVASHDLKEPLRMVKAYTQLLLGRYQSRLDAEAQQFVGFVIEGASRMEALINDLLAYAAVGKAESLRQTFDLHSPLQIALGNLREQIGQCRAEIVIEPMPTIDGVESQLAQVFQNLIGNALKFRSADSPVIRVSSRADGDHWLICVRDNGIGIEPEYLDKIFAIFQRLHGRGEYPGTGVGLSICKKIVERHGGHIWAESEPGEGSTFYFTLPRKEGLGP